MSPRGSFVFSPLPNHTFRATLAMGYRPPTPHESYADTRAIITVPSPFPSPIQIANRGSGALRPEKIISYELEYQGWYFGHRLRTRATVFYNHLSDLITFSSSGITQAGGVADIHGGEVGIEFLATKWLSGYGNFSYQEIGQTLTGTSQWAGPRFKYNAGLHAHWENGISGEISYHYVGATRYPLSQSFSNFIAFGVLPPDPYVGNYHLLNLRGGLSVLGGSNIEWLSPRGRGSSICLQRAQRHTPRTSVGGPHRESGHGLVDCKAMREHSQATDEGIHPFLGKRD
jgi:iron complex outermembrane receptor protein